MDAQQRNTIEALERVLVFLTTDPLPVPLQNTPFGFQSEIQTLRDAITEANTQMIHQGSGQVQKFTQYRRRVRAILRNEHLLPIRKVGTVLERLVPGMPRLVNLPAKLGSEKHLLIAAAATARDIEPFQQAFIERGFPADFLGKLRSALAALENVKSNYAEFLAKKLAGRAGIKNALRAGRDARKCLHEIVVRCCLADPVNGPGTLNAWNRISRTRRTGQTGSELSIVEPGVEFPATPGHVTPIPSNDQEAP